MGDNGASSSGHTPSEVVIVLSGAVDGMADDYCVAFRVKLQPALGALALKLSPRGRARTPNKRSR
jgi:hypothetical protein